MDNIITSAIPPAAGLAVADKPVTGQIVEVPNLLNKIKVGDSILLQVMFDSDAFRLNTDLRVNLLVNNQKTPLRLHFDQPLQISADEPHQLMAKIIARPQSSMQFQLVSIDNQKPETFATSADAAFRRQCTSIRKRLKSGYVSSNSLLSHSGCVSPDNQGTEHVGTTVAVAAA